MLYAIENLLAPAVKAILPETVQVLAGPSRGAPAKDQERVEIAGSELAVTANAADPFAPRGPASLTAIQRWSADGATADFTLPPSVEGEVLEVECPPGRPARRGEDYVLDGATLRFYRPPAAGEAAVVATVRTGAAAGFQERRPCTAQLELIAWGKDVTRADQLLDQALVAVLARCVDLETLVAEHLGSGAVRMRLLKPALLLEGLQRAAIKIGTRRAHQASARLRLHAELELAVVTGAPAPEAKIGRVEYRAAVARAE